MSVKLFLAEMLKTIKPFGSNMEPIVGYIDDQGYSFSGRNPDGRYFKVTPKTQFPEFEGPSCFGKINYLNSIFDSSFIKDSTVSFEYGVASDKKTSVLQRIHVSSKRMSAVYQAMDPLLSQTVALVSRPLTFTNFPTSIEITKENLVEFKEVKKMISAYEKPDLLRLELEDGNLNIYFDVRGDKTNILLKDNIVGPNVSLVLAVDQFETILSLAVQPKSKLFLSDKAVKTEVEMEHADYLFLVSRKKEGLKKIT